MNFRSLATTCLVMTVALAADASTTKSVAASHDAMIFGNAQTARASGAGPGMFAGKDTKGNAKRALVTFDLASAGIPSTATIDSVTMKLVLGQVGGAGTGGSGSAFKTRLISVYHLTKAWSEGTSGTPTSATMAATGSGYPAATGDVTWVYADDATSSWTTAGGDFTATALATTTITYPFPLGTTYSWSSAAMATEVKNWLTTPGGYHGWIIKSNLEADDQSFLGWWTKDGATANHNTALAPVLTITWH